MATTPSSLIVSLDAHNNVRVGNMTVPSETEPQAITWHLHPDLVQKNAKFLYFIWEEEPTPPQIFGPFTPIPGTDAAVMVDWHNGPPENPLVYRLAIQVGGTTYWTPPPTPGHHGKPGTGGSPNIKNN
jgi:hypothetical protein